MRFPGFLLPGLLLAAAACGPPDTDAGAAAGSTDTVATAPVAPESADIAAELLAADSAFARETAEGGAAAWAGWFEADGSMVRGTGEIRGRTAIREAMEPALSDTTVHFTWSPQRAIHAGGDLGATIGTYRIEGVGPGAGAAVQEGMYLTLWRRQPDGSWKAAADLGSPAG
jgi:ketosteroid isomerase-like protein